MKVRKLLDLALPCVSFHVTVTVTSSNVVPLEVVVTVSEFKAVSPAVVTAAAFQFQVPAVMPDAMLAKVVFLICSMTNSACVLAMLKLRLFSLSAELLLNVARMADKAYERMAAVNNSSTKENPWALGKRRFMTGIVMRFWAPDNDVFGII